MWAYQKDIMYLPDLWTHPIHPYYCLFQVVVVVVLCTLVDAEVRSSVTTTVFKLSVLDDHFWCWCRNTDWLAPFEVTVSSGVLVAPGVAIPFRWACGSLFPLILVNLFFWPLANDLFACINSDPAFGNFAFAALPIAFSYFGFLLLTSLNALKKPWGLFAEFTASDWIDPGDAASPDCSPNALVSIFRSCVWLFLSCLTDRHLNDHSTVVLSSLQLKGWQCSKPITIQWFYHYKASL